MNVKDSRRLQHLYPERAKAARDKIIIEIQEAEHMHWIATHSREILDDIDRQFSEQTALNKVDLSFLFLAVGLQVVRQYLLTSFPERLDDQTAAKQTPGHQKEHSHREHRYYNPSLSEIITNPVPFDANLGANGALSGGGSLGHRVTTIGHDPILGLLFGTANIATSTLTTWDMRSFHITTNAVRKQDSFGDNADTIKVFRHLYEKTVNQGMEGRIIVASALGKEIVHLRSDIQTKHSLPLPIIPIIDPKWASSLAEYGFDSLNVATVAKQASLAILINTLITLVHGAFFNGTSKEQLQLHEVKTRKILLYSNLIASSSNVLYVAISSYFGNLDAMRKLDIGGLAVTLFRLISDVKFIYQIREEFISSHFIQKLSNPKTDFPAI